MLHGITTGGRYEIYTSVSYYYVDFICRRIIEFFTITHSSKRLWIVDHVSWSLYKNDSIISNRRCCRLADFVLFVPSAVGLMNVKEELFENIAVIMIVLVISTVIVMVVTGKVAQYMIERKNINE